MTDDNDIQLKVKLKKLQLARKIAASKSKKLRLRDDAEKLVGEYDNKIKSLATNKFVVAKSARLKSLGKDRNKINDIIKGLETPDENILERKTRELKSAVSGLGLDKRFVGKSADEILAMVGVETENENKKEKRFQTQGIPKKPSRETENENKKEKRFQSLTLNSDIIKDTNETNERIYDYLVKTGQLDVAEYVLDLMTAPNAGTQNLSDINKNTAEVKRLSKINERIHGVLKKIEEDMIDEQDTSISIAARPKREKNAINAGGLQQVQQGKGNDLSSLLSQALGMAGAGAAGLGAGALAGRFLPSAASLAKVALPAAAVAAAAGYIGYQIDKRQTQYELATTQGERNEARIAQGAGLAGAAVGAVAGAKAMGALGALVGTMGFPGVGTVIGGASGVIIGGAAGAAAGYYMGDAVSGYIAEMWSGPLDKVPDNKRNNPFVLHEYLAMVMIPEFQKALIQAQQIGDQEKIKDIANGIEEYTQIAKDILAKDNIVEWMETKLKDSNLENADWMTKRDYLFSLMSEYKKADFYYRVGVDAIPTVAPEPTKASINLNKLTFGLFGTEPPPAANAEREHEAMKLAAAKEVIEFNKTNKLGKDGESLLLTSGDGDKNFDELVKAGIIVDEWGKNKFGEGAIAKLEQMPVETLKTLLVDGNLKAADAEILRKIISKKEKEGKSVSVPAKPAEEPVSPSTPSPPETPTKSEAHNVSNTINSSGLATMVSSQKQDTSIPKSSAPSTAPAPSTLSYHDQKIMEIVNKYKGDPARLDADVAAAQAEIDAMAASKPHIKLSSGILDFDNDDDQRKYIGLFDFVKRSKEAKAKLLQLASQDNSTTGASSLEGAEIGVPDQGQQAAVPEKVPYTMTQPAIVGAPSTGSVPSVPTKAGASTPVPVGTRGNSLNPDDYSLKNLFTLSGISEKDFNGMHPTMMSNLKAMGAEYLDKYGKKMQINSAWRSFEKQAALKRQYGERAAAPGSSMHNYGLAVDINSRDANAAGKAGLLQKYGFWRPVPGEDWHVEPQGIDRAKIRAMGMKAGSAAIAESVAIPEKAPPSSQIFEGEMTNTEESKEKKAVAEATTPGNVGSNPIGNVPEKTTPYSWKGATLNLTTDQLTEVARLQGLDKSALERYLDMIAADQGNSAAAPGKTTPTVSDPSALSAEIGRLTNEYELAKQAGDTERMKKIQSQIDIKKQELSRALATAPTPNKDVHIANVERNQTENVANTRSGSSVSATPAQQVNVNINNNAPQGKEQKSGAFDLFDNSLVKS